MHSPNQHHPNKVKAAEWLLAGQAGQSPATTRQRAEDGPAGRGAASGQDSQDEVIFAGQNKPRSRWRRTRALSLPATTRKVSPPVMCCLSIVRLTVIYAACSPGEVSTCHYRGDAHRLSRFACRRAPAARVLARCFSVLGERRARSPVGSPVTAGPSWRPASRCWRSLTTATGRHRPTAPAGPSMS